MADEPTDERVTVAVEYAGRLATVRRNAGHPEQYLYVDYEEGRYFLGVLEPGMMRGDVKRMAVAWMKQKVGQR